MTTFATRTALWAVGLAFAFGLAAEPARAHFYSEDGSKIRAGMDAARGVHAHGSARFWLTGDYARLELRMWHLQPDAEYALLFDGEQRVVFTATSWGAARVELDTDGSDDGLLDFDPRTDVLQVVNTAGPVLTADLYEDARDLVARERGLLTAGAAASGQVRFSFSQIGRLKRDFSLRASGMEPGSYTVVVRLAQGTGGTALAEVYDVPFDAAR